MHQLASYQSSHRLFELTIMFAPKDCDFASLNLCSRSQYRYLNISLINIGGEKKKEG